jgi:hypothetical protein
MKQSRLYTYYTIFEIAIMLGISIKSARNKISKLGIKKHKTNSSRVALYTDEQVEILRGERKLNQLSYDHLVSERNKAPVIITYYIYESKMNK